MRTRIHHVPTSSPGQRSRAQTNQPFLSGAKATPGFRSSAIIVDMKRALATLFLLAGVPALTETPKTATAVTKYGTFRFFAIEMGAAILERRPSTHKFNKLESFGLSVAIA